MNKGGSASQWTTVEKRKRRDKPRKKRIRVPDDVIRRMTGPERALLTLLQGTQFPMTIREMSKHFKDQGVTRQMIGDILYGDVGRGTVLHEYVEISNDSPKTWRIKRVPV